MSDSQRHTVPANGEDPFEELLEEVAILSQLVPRAYAALTVAAEHAGESDAFGHLALSLYAPEKVA